MTINHSTKEIVIVVGWMDPESFYHGEHIAVYDYNGVLLRTSNTQKNNFTATIFGVAINTANHDVYAAGKNRLMRFSRQLELLNTVTYRNSDFRGVAVVDDQVMVCDYNSCIKVYSKDLKYIRSIGSHGNDPGQMNGINDISADNLGNLYIADENKFCIHVFSAKGTYIRSIKNQNQHIENQKPRCVYVAGQYVYVATICNVNIFTTTGDFVNSSSTTSHYYKSTYGVCVDEDGFVYISCNYKDRISSKHLINVI